MSEEAKLKVKIRELFKSPEFFTFHYSAYMGVAGLPDRLGYLKANPWPIPFWIEVKAPGKKLNPNQVAKKALATRLGIPILSPCDHVDQAKEFKKKLLRMKNKQEEKQ